jgi:NitT/TauT family transport system ATP-binding protein
MAEQGLGSITASVDETMAPADSVSAGCLIRFRDVGQVFSAAAQQRRRFRQAASASVSALEKINLDIPAGQFVAIVGASGCGKTTLLNMVAGLISPTSGEIELAGTAPRCPNLDIGYMFARDRLLPWRSAQRNVELPLEVRGWARSERADGVRKALELVGLKGRENAYPLELSQGMRQRVALARTLVCNPSILLMDEPFGALDARTRLAMQDEFLRIWEDPREESERKTVLFVTHDLQEAALLADRVIVMLPSPGRIADDRLIRLPRPRAGTLGQLAFSREFQEVTRELFDRLEGALPDVRGHEGKS